MVKAGEIQVDGCGLLGVDLHSAFTKVEGIFRIPAVLRVEFEEKGGIGCVTYRELARLMNQFGHKKKAGGE